MSWEVVDEDMLRPPERAPEGEPIDALDRMIVEGMGSKSPTGARPSKGEGEAAKPAQGESLQVELSDLPPPPPSAAFDSRDEGPHERPTYESGSFVADTPGEEGEGGDVADSDSEGGAEFNIPTLTGAGAEDDDSGDEPVQAESPAPEAESPAPEGEDAGFVIPTLSASAGEAGEEDGAAEEIEEIEEVDAVADEDIPVRTGDTVISRAPEPSAEELAARESASTTSVAASVYDDFDEDEDAPAPAAEEERPPVEAVVAVDSGEFEILPDEDTAVEPAPTDPDADTVVEPAPTEADADKAPAAEESADYVIPTLARPEPEPEVAAEPEVEPEVAAEPEPEGEVVMVDPASVVIPMLTRSEPEAAAEPAPEPAAEDTQVEAVEEVEVEAIESIDGEEIEELEGEVQVQEVEVEADAPAPAAEPKPPTPPPEAPKPKSKAKSKRRKGWYDDVFAEHFLFLYPPSWEETTRRDAEFIHTQIGGVEGAALLDVGCGDGRHAIELSKLGYRVTGVDNSLALLLSAAQNKEAAGLEDSQVEFLHGDMRRLPRDRDFDAVICVGTTFGYFDDEQNQECLEEMHDRLRPGGRLLLHVFNRDFVAPHLPARSWWQGKRCMVLDEAEMNFFANRLRIHRTVIFDDGRQYEHYMFMRAYTVQDLGKAMSGMGMRVLEVSGSRDTRGRFYGSASPDIWIVAERKA